MNLLSFDLRILALCVGVYAGIGGLIKEYQKVKVKSYKRCFLFYILAVLFFEVDMVWGIVLLCSDSFWMVRQFGSYMVLSLALTCFCFSGYIFTDNVLNGDVSSKDKLQGKVAIGIGIYLTVGTMLFL